MRIILLAILATIIMFFIDVLLPKLKTKLKLKYLLYKEEKVKRERQKAFRNKMKELEIK